MSETIKALEFYKRIKNKSSYKLVNGLFIVKNQGKGIYKFVGDFDRKGSLGATPSISYVKLIGSNQLFDIKDKTTMTSLGLWKKLTIKFKMQPIKEILRWKEEKLNKWLKRRK